ncbi:hypothetical protein PAPYR_6536 [Paratrimastix pyriformis]|uniref:Uncharacterized protein n=1 Tax=Paratrimastix pyriformis TaxID=342808 RepID=A0ABQ8UF25_9EUKA|nr:hypothetical protein PAPYR_6536 [Paratrimastix pyriformis]
MLIRIRLNDTHEWVLLELQGRIESKLPEISGLELGKLKILTNPKDPKDVRCWLKIGNQLLEGTLIQLKNPIAVMKKIVLAQPVEGTQGPPGAEIEESTRYEIEGVARYKMHFNTRPLLSTRTGAGAAALPPQPPPPGG